MDYYQHKKEHRHYGIDETNYRKELYPTKPGIPNSITADIELQLASNPSIQNKEYLVNLVNRYSTHPLFLDHPVLLRDFLKKSIMKAIKDMKDKVDAIPPSINNVRDIKLAKKDHLLDTQVIIIVVSW